MNKKEVLEWARHFAEYRHRARYESCSMVVDTDGYDLLVKNGKEEGYIGALDLGSFSVPVLNLQTFVVVPNTKENVEALLTRWDEFASQKLLWIIFINPASPTEHKWMIQPFVHAMITETAHLRLGIESLASTVDWC